MMNFFNNFNIDLPMNNWFMPNLSFSNFNSCDFNLFPSFSISYFNNIPSLNFNFFSDFLQPMPQFSIFNNTDIFNSSKKSDTNNTDVFVKSSSKVQTKTEKISLDNYNAVKGKKLADIAMKNVKKWSGFCARFVKRDIQEAGLGAYQPGHAYQMSSILRNNPNFKEISPDNVNLQDLPEGCVLVYGRGIQGYSKAYGHTEITVKDKKTGKIKAVSDGITNNLYRKPTAIFIPV